MNLSKPGFFPVRVLPVGGVTGRTPGLATTKTYGRLNCLPCALLQKSCFLETEETPTDDDVIQEVDLKDLRSRRNALGDL